MTAPREIKIAWPDHIKSARLGFWRPWRHPSEKALAAVLAWTSDPDVARFCGFQAHQHIDQARAQWQRMRADWVAGKAQSYLVSLVDAPERLIGNFHIKAQGSRLNLGFAYVRTAWRQGFGLEALRFWSAWGLAQPEIWRTEAFCDVENTASRALIETAGFAYEGRLRRFYLQPQISPEPRDVFMFARVREPSAIA